MGNLSSNGTSNVYSTSQTPRISELSSPHFNATMAAFRSISCVSFEFIRPTTVHIYIAIVDQCHESRGHYFWFKIFSRPRPPSYYQEHRRKSAHLLCRKGTHLDVIKHDYKGRSSAPGSLALWVRSVSISRSYNLLTILAMKMHHLKKVTKLLYSSLRVYELTHKLDPIRGTIRPRRL